ncbi:MAG: nitronate monooxygenase, partial [bacterium]|nr:nitronate monooxygenase [bacterium]
MRTRISELLGIDIPVVQAPMGYIARAQLASAVSNAGAMGIIETSSGQLNDIKVEIAKMRDLTDRSWGVNIAQLLMPDATVIEFVIEHGVGF